MTQYIDKDAIVAEIRKTIKNLELYIEHHPDNNDRLCYSFKNERLAMFELLSFIDTLEVKEADFIIHTIISECCDWLAMNTNLSHDEIESCRKFLL